MGLPPFELEFYTDANGDQPVLRWIKEMLTPTQRRALGAAMSEILQRLGSGVCTTEYGKSLGRGLFEFRLRHSAAEVVSRGHAHADRTQPRSTAGEAILLRVFCHASGERLILLAGYDKAANPSPRRQEREIALARKRLTAWQRARGS